MLVAIIAAGNIPMNNHTKPYPHKTCILVEKQMMNPIKNTREKKWWKRKQERGINVGNERVTILDKADREIFIEGAIWEKMKRTKVNKPCLSQEKKREGNIRAKALRRPGSEEPSVAAAKWARQRAVRDTIREVMQSWFSRPLWFLLRVLDLTLRKKRSQRKAWTGKGHKEFHQWAKEATVLKHAGRWIRRYCQ